MKTLKVVSKRGPRAVAVCLAALLTLQGSLPVICAAAGTGGGNAAAAVRARRGDGRAIDRGAHGLRRHAHRHHQSRDRRRGGRAAARDPRRRQEVRHGQPDRLGCGHAPPVRHRGRAGDHRRSSSTCRRSFRARRSRSASATKPSSCPASCRAPPSCSAPARSPPRRRPRARSSTCSRCPAAARASR